MAIIDKGYEDLYIFVSKALGVEWTIFTPG